MQSIEIFDDIIDKPLQEKIKSTLFINTFPWYFISDITTSSAENKERHRPGFLHLFYDNFKKNSDYFSMVQPIIDHTASKLKLKSPQIIKSRAFLQLPLSLKDYTVDNAHIDNKRPHIVFLYYVTDSDGDTIIYDKKWEKGKQSMNREETSKLLIKKRVTPKQGRVVVFDGKYWHTAEQPKHNNRCVINNNITNESV